MSGKATGAKGVSKVRRHRTQFVPSFIPQEKENNKVVDHKEPTKSAKLVTAQPDLSPTHSSDSEKDSDDYEEPVRRIIQPKLLDVDDDDKVVGLSDDEDSDEEIERQRERARLLAQQRDDSSDDDTSHKQLASEVVVTNRKTEVKQEEEEEEESGEWETDSSDDEFGENLIKPTFVAKSRRATLHQAEIDEEKEEKEELQAKEERINETRDFLQETLTQTVLEEQKENELSDEEGDPEAELEKWKLREIARLIRDKKDRHPELFESPETESTKERKVKERKKMKFMQKYYHKGAFYQDEEILKRDYTEATGEDLLNKELLPKVMQVKNFGKSGRTKYTHLVDQDTTDRAAWGIADKRERSSRQRRRD